MKYNAIIFDIDGTLWSASPGTTKAWNNALKALNSDKRVTLEGIESVTGRPFNECIEILLPGLSEKYPNLRETLNEHELIVTKNEGGTFFPDVIEGIRELAKETPIYIISNCEGWYLQLFLKFSGFADSISDYDCNGTSNLQKGDMLKNMIKKHNLTNAVYIGDTAGDEEGAKQASTDFIYVSYGFGKPENESKQFDNFSNLVQYLKTSP